MQKIKCYTIDLTKIDGSGEFRYLRCGTEIFPDDETEDVYTILETITEENCLEKIILRCNRFEARFICARVLHLACNAWLVE